MPAGFECAVGRDRGLLLEAGHLRALLHGGEHGGHAGTARAYYDDVVGFLGGKFRNGLAFHDAELEVALLEVGRQLASRRAGERVVGCRSRRGAAGGAQKRGARRQAGPALEERPSIHVLHVSLLGVVARGRFSAPGAACAASVPILPLLPLSRFPWKGG